MEFIEIGPSRVPKKKAAPVQKIVTDNMITPYEFARLQSLRAKQIRTGYPPLVEWSPPFNPILIARDEIIEKKLPLILIRKIPDGDQPLGYRVEEWDIRDMDIRDI